MLAPILAAIESFDTLRASDELSRLAAVLSPRELVHQVAVPLMREVGIRWHNGTLAIAQEHLVSQMLRTLLGSMLRLFRPLNPAMTMVLSTPAGESHEFGILAAAMLASLGGVEPVFLGPNLPAREIADAARRTSAKVVALSITFPSETTQEELNALAEAMPEDAELWGRWREQRRSGSVEPRSKDCPSKGSSGVRKRVPPPEQLADENSV